MIGSIAAYEPYPGGGGYNAAKFGERALASVLRQELLGQPVRVTEIDPGMVETEFSLVRFDGDAERAAKVYEGVTPLTADDVAECIAFAATRPSHVNIDSLVVLARDQAGARNVHRRPTDLTRLSSRTRREPAAAILTQRRVGDHRFGIVEARGRGGCRGRR